MSAQQELSVTAALQTAREAYRAVLALYVDPDDEIARAETPVPPELAEAVRLCRITVEHLMNATV